MNAAATNNTAQLRNSYTKYDALRNHILIIETSLNELGPLNPKQSNWPQQSHWSNTARSLLAPANPAQGPGGDQLLLIARATNPANNHANTEYWLVRVFNADGSTAGMCGNGTRCVMHHAFTHYSEAAATISFINDDGVTTRTIYSRAVLSRAVHSSDKSKLDPKTIDTFVAAQVDIGTPMLALDKILVECANAPDRVIAPDSALRRRQAHRISLAPADDPALATALLSSGCEPFVHVVNVGNPHAILWYQLNVYPLSNQIRAAHVQTLGPLIQALAWQGVRVFPQGVNVSIAALELGSMDAITLLLETYERGSGYTHACASGACAAAFVALSKFDQNLSKQTAIIRMSGGDLRVLLLDTPAKENASSLEEADFTLVMEGPATPTESGLWHPAT